MSRTEHMYFGSWSPMDVTKWALFKTYFDQAIFIIIGAHDVFRLDIQMNHIFASQVGACLALWQYGLWSFQAGDTKFEKKCQ